MDAVTQFSSAALLNMCVSLLAAFFLGGAIGFERQIRQRTAGLRTNTLVAVGAAVFVSLGHRLNVIHGGSQGAVQIVAYVISGIGFLGAGAIMKEGANVTGLNTAATLWGSAAVGACSGAGLIGEAAVAALFVLASNTLLRPVVNRINRRPVNEESSEATYYVFVICRRDTQADVLEQITALMEAAGYPVRDIEQHPFGQADTEIQAALYATAIIGEELDQVLMLIEDLPSVVQAFWNSKTEG